MQPFTAHKTSCLRVVENLADTLAVRISTSLQKDSRPLSVSLNDRVGQKSVDAFCVRHIDGHAPRPPKVLDHHGYVVFARLKVSQNKILPRS